jgi:hypothetical protein
MTLGGGTEKVRDVEVMGGGSPGYAKKSRMQCTTMLCRAEQEISGEGTRRLGRGEGKDERTYQASVTCLGWGGSYAGCSISGSGSGEADAVLQGAKGG